jgi:hypothetical protein
MVFPREHGDRRRSRFGRGPGASSAVRRAAEHSEVDNHRWVRDWGARHPAHGLSRRWRWP